MSLNAADHFTIIQSYQKDDLYRSKLRLQIKQFFSYFLPQNKHIGLQTEFDLISDCIYYLLTTISTRQTIGQEYCNLILYDEIKRNVPSRLKRVYLIGIKIILPYILYKFKFDKLLRKISRKHFKLLQFAFDLLKMCYYYANSLSTIAFFLTHTTYFKFENFITNIKYLKLTNLIGQQQQGALKFQLLALSLCLPFLYNLYFDFKKIKFYFDNFLHPSPNDICSSENTDGDAEVSDGAMAHNNVIIRVKPNRKCLLCLDFIKNSTLTPCGHCFCWYCINEYTVKTRAYSDLSHKYQTKCPICRDLFQINKLVFLFNY